MLPVYAEDLVGLDIMDTKDLPMPIVTPADLRRGDITKKGANRERAIQVAFQQAMTPKALYHVAKNVIEVASDKDHPQFSVCAKEVMNRMLGKVPLKVQQTTTTVKTVEERKTFFLKMLGVNQELIEGEVVSSSQEGDSGQCESDPEVDFAALPAEVSPGQEPVHPVGEVEANWSDVGERPQERDKEDQPLGTD